MELRVLFNEGRRSLIRRALESGEPIPFAGRKPAAEPAADKNAGSAEDGREKSAPSFSFTISRSSSGRFQYGGSFNYSRRALNNELILAVEKGDTAAVSVALAHGADPNADDRFMVPENQCRPYRTALMIARRHNFGEIERQLVDAGAK